MGSLRSPRWLLGLAALATLAATADVQAAKGKKGDPCAGTTVWTSAPNFLPLALVRGGSITRPRGECEGDFWRAGVRFTAIDARGGRAGVATWTEGNGGSGLRRTSGADGAGLFVKGERWKGAPSVEFEPDAETKRAFDALYVRVAKHHPTAMTFFRATAKTTGAPSIYAAGSGRALVVGYLDDRGRWQRAYADHWKANKTREPFHVRAVLDLNGDGRPEVVAFLREAENMGYDVVLSPSRGGRRYRLVAENPDDGP